MLVDFEVGRPPELEFLNGKLQEYAGRHGLPCETNRLLMALAQGILLHLEQSGDLTA